MQNTSSLYKELIKQSGRMFKAEIAVTFPNGSTTTLTDKNIMQDSLVITSGRSDEGSFSIGNAIIGQLDFEIDNSSGAYDNLSFEDAVFDVRAALIVRQSYDGTLTPEWIRKGIFTAEEVTVDENYIKVTAYDNLAKLDVPFSDSGITFPVTLGNLYQSVCAHCSVPYGNTDFSNSNLVITSGNDIDENTSCRDVLSYIAQLACCFVYADVNGTVKLGWYTDTSYEVTEEQKISGTVTVSGVQLTDTKGSTWLSGTSNYCIVIEDNPLAKDQTALNSSVWSSRLIGMELTPFSAEIFSDPSLEAGDIVTVSDPVYVNWIPLLSEHSYNDKIVANNPSVLAPVVDADSVRWNRFTFISASGGELTNTKAASTDFIPVQSGSVIKYTGEVTNTGYTGRTRACAVAYYSGNSDAEFIVRHSLISTVSVNSSDVINRDISIVPKNAKYMRVTYSYLSGLSPALTFESLSDYNNAMKTFKIEVTPPVVRPHIPSQIFNINLSAANEYSDLSNYSSNNINSYGYTNAAGWENRVTIDKSVVCDDVTYSAVIKLNDAASVCTLGTETSGYNSSESPHATIVKFDFENNKMQFMAGDYDGKSIPNNIYTGNGAMTL